MSDDANREERITDSRILEECDDNVVVMECIEELEELIMTLDRYPPSVIVVALGTCFEGLLGALFDEHQCTVGEVRGLLREIESGVLNLESPAKE